MLDRAGRVVDSQVASIKIKLDAVTDHLQMVAALAGSGRLDISSPVDMREALWVMMTQVPAISSAAFATFDLKLVRVEPPSRRPGDPRHRLARRLAAAAWNASASCRPPMSPSGARCSGTTSCSQPVLNVRTPIRRIDDAFIGGLLATVALGDLSLLIGEASQESGGRYFILVGRDRVLAHRRLVDPRGLGLSADRELPTIKEVDDPVLARIWSPPIRSPQLDRGWAISAMSSRPRGDAGCSSTASCVGYGPRALAGRAILSAGGSHQRPRPADQRRHRRCAPRSAVAALLALLIGLSMARSIRTITSAAEIDRAAGVRPAVPPRLAAARDRRCRPQPRQGARRA